MNQEKINKTIKQIEEYIQLYEGDKPFLKNKTEISINNRTIQELKHIRSLLK